MKLRILGLAACLGLGALPVSAQETVCQNENATLGIHATANPQERILEVYSGNARQMLNLMLGFGNRPAADGSLQGMIAGIREVTCTHRQTPYRDYVARFIVQQNGQVRRLPRAELPPEARLIAVNGRESSAKWVIVPGFVAGRANVAAAFFVEKGAATEELHRFLSGNPDGAVTCDSFAEGVQCQFVVSINGNVTQ